MATTPREKLTAQVRTFEAAVESGAIDPASADAIRELIHAYDDDNVLAPTPVGESSREPETLRAWLYRLIVFAKHRTLTTASAADLNGDVQAMLDGRHPEVKDDGLQKGTLRSYQAALRVFYRYHDDLGVDPEEIPLFDQDETAVDPTDMLTREEILQAQQAAGNPRDRVVFDLLLYTGQRREAIRTLRLRDVDIEAGTYRLNPDVDGLKGALKRNGNRPLLSARASVREWLKYHPARDDPDAYLITARPNWSQVDPSEPVSGETIRRIMADIKAETDIQKPMHPHAMRHNFVTIAKRDHGMPDDTIIYLIGHDEASDVMKTTYTHLSGDDYVQNAEEAWGIREPDPDSAHVPNDCDWCGYILPEGAKACPGCGQVLTLDAKTAEDQIRADMKGSFRETDPTDADDMDLQDKLDRLDALMNDPELRQYARDNADE